MVSWALVTASVKPQAHTSEPKNRLQGREYELTSLATVPLFCLAAPRVHEGKPNGWRLTDHVGWDSGRAHEQARQLDCPTIRAARVFIEGIPDSKGTEHGVEVEEVAE